MALQRPPYVWMNGRLTPWDDARIHVGAEALTRGISVFEGIKGYWRHDGSRFALLALREHYDRLVRSAMLQHLPFAMDFEAFREACLALVRTLLTRERDLWLRTTLLALEGHWGLDTVTDLVITCYHQDMKRPDPVALGISSWQRPSDNAYPARIKAAANYQLARLARIEARRQGLDDVLLLNPAGRVAEATGSCVLVVRNGRVATPPHHEGCLESITVDIVESLCRGLGIPFERRPVERSEVLVADELALAGTLQELAVVSRLNDRAMPQPAPVIERIAQAYWSAVRGVATEAGVRLTPV